MKIAPSVLAADFSNLECELKDIETGGADLVHLDVMDGTFVPNISFGPPVIQSLRKVTLLPFDVHLMTYHPEYYFDSLGKIGVDMISFHQEAVIHVDRTIHDIKSRGIKAGNLQIPIEVDGGVSSANAVLLKDAGADILVAGSSVFGAADRKKAIDVLRS